MKIYRCFRCGNILAKIEDKSEALTCCGEALKELEVNTSDGVHEKHLPVYEMKDNECVVRVGEVDHPMSEEHYIMWILVERSNGYSIKYLNPGDEPTATFLNTSDIKAIYAYCNLHGLYKTTVL